MQPLSEPTRQSLRADLESLGLRSGDIVLTHSSFKSLGIRDPEWIIGALLDVIGATGTLLMPALTYQQTPPEIHDARGTPTCVGYLTEYFRTRPGTIRSLHPTHSVCGVGARARELLKDHFQDTTPCGPFSPFRRLIENDGRILMLGCGLKPNTTMHAVEEYVRPPYLFGPRRFYTITDMRGLIVRKEYVTHGFHGYSQRYDRIAGLLDIPAVLFGRVGDAPSHLIEARALHRAAVEKMREDPFYFVEPHNAHP